MERIIYMPRRSGKCHIDLHGSGEVGEIEMGVIEVDQGADFLERPCFGGYYVKLIEPDGGVRIGHSASSVVAAMKALDDEMAESGGRLLCAGLHPDFYETGLSEGTGFGYIKGYRDAVHIFERPLIDSRAKFHPHPLSMPKSPVACGLSDAIKALRTGGH